VNPRRPPVLLLLPLLVGAACGPVSPPAGPDVTMNSCPDHPCSAYDSQGATAPVCVSWGACLVTQATFASLVLAVQIPETSPSVPGQTYLVPFDASFLASQDLASPAGVLQILAARPSDAQSVGWYLGNPGLDTALPIQATFRRHWPDDECANDAATLGLPVLPLQADSIVYRNVYPGPFEGPSLAFQASMQPGCYERTIMPEPPLDQAFPPDVQLVHVPADTTSFVVPLWPLDTTNYEPDMSNIQPTFTISAPMGQTLDGYTAYLRDQTTLRRISSLRPLAGKSTTVLLSTDHHPPSSNPSIPGDALENAQLVIAPPAGSLVPTYVATPLGGQLSAIENPPALPPPVQLQGTVTSGGLSQGAHVAFEATAIVDSEGLNSTNWELTTEVTTALDASGDQAFSISLPPGQYRVTVRPTDASTGAEVTLFPVTVPQQASVTTMSFDLAPLRAVSGSVTLTDGRPLVGATVEVVPTQCASGMATTDWCMPRAAPPATTDPFGNFTMMLDDGTYQLSVRPADGTALPWVVQQLLVTPSITQPTVSVPAPFLARLSMTMGKTTQVANAMVRVFDTSKTPAAEVARGMTDDTGHVDIYLAPPTQ
jgi:hypothetical protein